MSLNGTSTIGPERDHREGHERRDRRDAPAPGGRPTLSAAFGDDVLLERQLHAVGQRLQQAEGAVHVGADAVLHPGHDPALPPDVEQREQHQDQEDQHGLDAGSATTGRGRSRRRVVDVGEQRRDRAGRDHCVRSLHGDAAAGRGRGRRARRCRRSWRHPDHAVGACSATSAGRVTEPRSPVTVTLSAEGVVRRSALTRATGTRAVARRWSSPSCIEPLSSSCFQVASASPSAVEVGRRRRACTGSSAARSPSQGPISSISARASATVRKPERACRAPRRCRRGPAGRAATAGLLKHRVERPRAALPGDERAGLVGDRARPGTRRRRRGSRRSRAARGRPRTTPRRARRGRPRGRRCRRGRRRRRPGRRARRRRARRRSRRRRGPAASGRLSTPQVVAASTRAAASATGRPPGSRLGRQPVSTAPRSPARRGTQASRAPVVRGQRRPRR